MPTDAPLSWVTLSELWKSRASFAEQLTSEELQCLHIETPLDQGLLDLVRQGKNVYLTGNPGDGKTHLLGRYYEQLASLNAVVELDASAEDEEALVSRISAAIEAGHPVVVAINEGPLRSILNKLPDAHAEDLRLQVGRPLLYGAEADPELDTVLVNLGLRDVLAKKTVSVVLGRLLEIFDFSDAPEPVIKNRTAFESVRVRGRLEALLELAAIGGGHVTMHELLGFLAYTITSGPDVDPTEIQSYESAAFSEANPLQSLLSRLDPVALVYPDVDAAIWDGDPNRVIEWLSPEDGRPLYETPMHRATARFDKLKRRYYFEAANGDALLDLLPTDHREFIQLVADAHVARQTATANLLQALAVFFGGRDADGANGDLPIWTGLRYEAFEPCTAYVSTQSVRLSDVTLERPRLRSQVAGLFEYVPDHLRLQVWAGESQVSYLDVDLELWVALMALKRGTPQQFQDRVIGRRLMQFMSSVAAYLEANRQSHSIVLVRDVDHSVTYKFRVATDKRQYQL